MDKKDELKYRAYQFSVDIIKFVSYLSEHRPIRIIIDQLIRAATSIGANIIEAQSASSKKDFIRFYEISLKSANETKYWLALLRDAFDIEKEKINGFLAEAQNLSNILAASVLTMKGKR